MEEGGETTFDSIPDTSAHEESVNAVDTEREEVHGEEEGDGGNEEENENPFADDDDEEDGVQVTIGEIRPNVQFSTKTEGGRGQQAAKGQLDIDAVPAIDGVTLYDIDLANSEDKPWRKPGADPSDYFNYGFTEETWNLYCERQKKLRAEFAGNQQMVNRHIMSGINLTNPLAPTPMRQLMSGGDGNNKVLVDNTAGYKRYQRPQHNINDDSHQPQTVIRTIVGGSSVTQSTIPTIGTPDFSRPPPMLIPTMGGGTADHSSTAVSVLTSEPPPPGAEEATSTTSAGGSAPIQSIPTLGGTSGALIDTSMPPPGFNPSLPPPNMRTAPPMGLPNTNMPPPGFNPMMPPPNFNQMQYGGGRMGGPPGGYGGPPMGRGQMGRPPPLMGRDQYGDMNGHGRRDSSEFDRRHERTGGESSGTDDEMAAAVHRRSTRHVQRKKSRTPPLKRRSGRERDERREREERGRRHRSRSGERRERKNEEKKEKRGEDERSERKKRRHDKEEEKDKEREKSKRSKREDRRTRDDEVKQEVDDHQE